MKKNHIIICILIILIFNGITGCFEPQATDYFNKDLEVNENTILTAETINGQIEINTWDGETVSINAIKKSPFGGEELEKIEINILETENTIDIEAVYGGDRATTPSVDMNIKVPESVMVKSATTSNGGIQIAGTKGDVVATTSNGNIIIDDVDGYVSAITSNGRIEVKGTKGIKELKSSNLGIEAEIYGFKDNVRISTSNGGITAYIDPSLNADIDMITSNGQVSITGVLLNLSLDEDKHKTGILGVGGKSINIQTSNGNIYLKKLEV